MMNGEDFAYFHWRSRYCTSLYPREPKCGVCHTIWRSGKR